MCGFAPICAVPICATPWWLISTAAPAGAFTCIVGHGGPGMALAGAGGGLAA